MTKVGEAAHAVAVIAEYCAHERALFANVRHDEQFAALHLGRLAETTRKWLSRLAKTPRRRRPCLPCLPCLPPCLPASLTP
jgi:hypothetical protein